MFLIQKKTFTTQKANACNPWSFLDIPLKSN